MAKGRGQLGFNRVKNWLWPEYTVITGRNRWSVEWLAAIAEAAMGFSNSHVQSFNRYGSVHKIMVRYSQVRGAATLTMLECRHQYQYSLKWSCGGIRFLVTRVWFGFVGGS